MDLNAEVMFNGSGQASPVKDPDNRLNAPLRHSAPGFVYQGPPELSIPTPSSRAPPPAPGHAVSPHKPASSIDFATSPTRTISANAATVNQNHPRGSSDPEHSLRPIGHHPTESLSRVSMFDRASVEDLPYIVPDQSSIQPYLSQQPTPASQRGVLHTQHILHSS